MQVEGASAGQYTYQKHARPVGAQCLQKSCVTDPAHEHQAPQHQARSICMKEVRHWCEGASKSTKADVPPSPAAFPLSLHQSAAA